MLTQPACGRPARFVGVSLKLYLGHVETLDWCRAVRDIVAGMPAVAENRLEVVVLPALTALVSVVPILAPVGVGVGAQDLWVEDRGSFTGQVSGADLAAIGCRFAEIGHAERRRIFCESDELIRAKVSAAARNGLVPLLCVGEDEHRNESDAAKACTLQLRAALGGLEGDVAPSQIVVAYEPVWAIGADQAAAPGHIAAVCTGIKEWMAVESAIRSVRVIYGGAAGEGLATELGDRVDGLFLGRSAHRPERLVRILNELALREP